VYGIVILPLVDVVLINRILQVLLGRSTRARQTQTVHEQPTVAAPSSAQQTTAANPLFAAILAGDEHAVQEQLQADIDINQADVCDERETTALILAATGGYVPIVRLLIEQGATIN